MSKKSKFNISMLKYNALKLRRSFQLPYKLVYHITIIDKDTNLEWVKYLSTMSEHLLRVKGYYKKYPNEEKNADSIIETAFKEFINMASGNSFD